MAAAEDDATQQLFKENSKEDFLAASEILLRLANNVLENPSEWKYRRIRVGNPLVQSKLLPLMGGLECLFDMGFLEDGEYLTLPTGSSLAVVRQVRDKLSRLCSIARGAGEGGAIQSQSAPPPPAPASLETAAIGNQGMAAGATAAPSSRPSPNIAQGQGQAAASASPRVSPMVQARPTQTLADIRRLESAFSTRIESTMSHVMLYEDPNLQQKARSMIPMATLKQAAEARIQSLPQLGGRETSDVDISDCLLLELLAWFKKSFFSWVDSPPCEHCGGSTHHAGSATPTSAELIWGGSRVENHKCDSCGQFTRFPRYNHPGKLLETRRGRCGEWANCFTLCCRAMGFEARYVLDWTDHVWTEAYSHSQKRWLHCDPCENVCDKPLLYEDGWGKKLTYVIAFSKDEVQDVTWRYSSKHPEVLARRNECREMWLVSTIHNICTRKFHHMAEARRQEMLHRLIVELVEFLTPKTPGNQNLPGRTTGSLSWRLARGELGKSTTRQHQYVFRLLESEKDSEVMHIKYSCAKDLYVRASSQDVPTWKWHSCSYSAKSVQRKEESDWKMAYLARDEGTETAEISWKFDLIGEDLCISKLELKAPSTTFENGSVTWRLCTEDNCFNVPGVELTEFQSFDLQRSQMLTITAVLSGGKGNVAWQHAQLFRQGLDDTDFPFQVILHLS